MDTLTILKLTPSLVRFTGDAMVYFGSRYAIRCEADEFKLDTESSASLSLETGGWDAVATCQLVPDPQRRGVRVGELSLAGVDLAEGRYWLCARMGGDVVFRAEVSVFAPSSGSVQPEPSQRWAVVDMGVVDGASVSLPDMTQARMVSRGNAAPLDVSAAGEPYEAYLVVLSTTGSFPFSDVLVNGSSPTWHHKDSLSLRSSEWTLHLVKVAGDVQAELHAAVAAGAESDPDGNLVTSMEVNS